MENKKIIIHTKNDEEIELSEYYIKYEEFVEFLNKIADKSENALSVEDVKNVPLEELDSVIKVSYVKIVVNFVYSDDGEMDSDEMQQVYSLMERIKMTAEERYAIIDYTSTHDEPVDSLLENIFSRVNEVTKANIIPSIMKDMLAIQNDTKDLDYRQSPFIMEMSQKLEFSDEAMQVVHEVILNDRKIFDKDIDDQGLSAGFSKIVSGAAAVGVPMAALYFSGSVVGLGASGIVSGLAALGFRGVLGFSSMATGIGVLLALSYGAHKGAQMLTGSNEIEARNKKKLLLLEVAKHQQRTINMIIMDIQYFVKKLHDVFEAEEAMKKDLLAKEKMVQSLFKKISILSGSASKSSDAYKDAEKNALQTRLPRHLDVKRLRAITENPTAQKFYEPILALYEEKTEEITKDGKTETKTVYELRTDLSLAQCENLANVLNKLGYFDVTSSLKGLFK